MLYNIAMYLYKAGVWIASHFNRKVRAMWEGEKRAYEKIGNMMSHRHPYLWFHAASLGEFEQGRPIIEAIRSSHPEYRILLTFFSPSGYEVRKSYGGADIVCYLPLDTPRNAQRFLSLIEPKMAFFIKYEFWYNYLNLLKERNIPIYSVSSIFRPGQVFFRKYAKNYSKVLNCFTHFFVQNEQSRKLLANIGITNVTISGDTRFDRVLEIKKRSKELPIIDAFVKNAKHVFVAGSSWQPDEDIFIHYFNRHSSWKLIIAPHVISEERVANIRKKIDGVSVRYTTTTLERAENAKVLVVDCFGLLSSIYRYADVAYVGGGFGAGIHNLLEAAVWSKPIFFGPNNDRFQEAQELKESGGGIEIMSATDFKERMDAYLSSPQQMAEDGQKAGQYVASKSGATQQILSAIPL